MCDFAIDLNEIPDKGTISSEFDAEIDALMPLAAEGLVELDGKRIIVTETGRPLVRLIAAAFDAYRANANSRHSVAV